MANWGLGFESGAFCFCFVSVGFGPIGFCCDSIRWQRNGMTDDGTGRIGFAGGVKEQRIKKDSTQLYTNGIGNSDSGGGRRDKEPREALSNLLFF